jgi:hypothetical protein
LLLAESRGDAIHRVGHHREKRRRENTNRSFPMLGLLADSEADVFQVPSMLVLQSSNE